MPQPVASARCSGAIVRISSTPSLPHAHQGPLFTARSPWSLRHPSPPPQESLLREQKTVMELFLKVLYQVLSPVQAALFVVEAFPYHCDVLALSNVLALVFGKDGSQVGGGVGPVGSGMGQPPQATG